MGNVIQANFTIRSAAPHWSRLPAHANGGCAFSSHDLVALACWAQSVERHGYRRTLLERGSDDGPDQGGYVLIYASGSQWARYGLARGGADILTWRCSDGADLGRTPTMLGALERLPPAEGRDGSCPKPIAALRRYPVACPA